MNCRESITRRGYVAARGKQDEHRTRRFKKLAPADAVQTARRPARGTRRSRAGGLVQFNVTIERRGAPSSGPPRLPPRRFLESHQLHYSSICRRMKPAINGTANEYFPRRFLYTRPALASVSSIWFTWLLPNPESKIATDASTIS